MRLWWIVTQCHRLAARWIQTLGRPRRFRGRRLFRQYLRPYITDTIECTIAGFGYAVARNKPFAGGFTTRHYGQPRNGVHTVQIEINRALYMNEVRIEKNAGFDRVAAQMTDVIVALAQLTAHDLAAE